MNNYSLNNDMLPTMFTPIWILSSLGYPRRVRWHRNLSYMGLCTYMEMIRYNHLLLLRLINCLLRL